MSIFVYCIWQSNHFVKKCSKCSAKRKTKIAILVMRRNLNNPRLRLEIEREETGKSLSNLAMDVLTM